MRGKQSSMLRLYSVYAFDFEKSADSWRLQALYFKCSADHNWRCAVLATMLPDVGGYAVLSWTTVLVSHSSNLILSCWRFRRNISTETSRRKFCPLLRSAEGGWEIEWRKEGRGRRHYACDSCMRCKAGRNAKGIAIIMVAFYRSIRKNVVVHRVQFQMNWKYRSKFIKKFLKENRMQAWYGASRSPAGFEVKREEKAGVQEQFGASQQVILSHYKFRVSVSGDVR